MDERRAQWAVTWRWAGRDGSHHQITLDIEGEPTEENVAEARRVAMAMGYPGHRGGFWNYLNEDFSRWFAPNPDTPPR